MSAATAPVQINADEIEITLKLNPRAVGVLLGGLDQLPHGVAKPLHDYLTEQTKVQVGAFVAAKQVAAAEEMAAASQAPGADPERV